MNKNLRKFCVAPMMGCTTPHARRLYRILSKKAFLFTEDGWYHLDRIYRRHPLKVIFLLHNVFEENKVLIHMDRSVFKRIIELYKSFVSTLTSAFNFVWGVIEPGFANT